MSGIVLINKKPGLTSFQTLFPLKRALKKTKIGHCGTLDKFAEGLIVALIGPMTRLNPFFSALDKEYEAKIVFGQESDTLDPEGVIVKHAPLPRKEMVKQAIKQLQGPILQRPPVYSAIKINGKRASDRVRQEGAQLEIAPRSVCIHSIQWLDEAFCPDLAPSALLKISCSKGTYIRSLARDLALACHSAAYVKTLKRTAIGYAGSPWAFQLDGAVFAEDFDPQKNIADPYEIAGKFDDLAILEIKPQYEKELLNGKPANISWFLQEPQGQKALVFNNRQQLMAALYRDAGRWLYRFVQAG